MLRSSSVESHRKKSRNPILLRAGAESKDRGTTARKLIDTQVREVCFERREAEPFVLFLFREVSGDSGLNENTKQGTVRRRESHVSSFFVLTLHCVAGQQDRRRLGNHESTFKDVFLYL